MSVPPKENEAPNENVKKIFARGLGGYDIQVGKVISHFFFPANATIEDNFAVISHLKDELLKAIQDKDKKEKPKVEPEKETPKVHMPIETEIKKPETK